MTKSILDKKFRHHSWFKEGKTVREAIDYFAKSGDFYLSKKPSKKQSDRLFDDTIYDNTITDGRSSYRISQEEIEFYSERKQYWKEQKEIEYQNWLNEEIDVDKKIRNYTCMNSHYDGSVDTSLMFSDTSARTNVTDLMNISSLSYPSSA